MSILLKESITEPVAPAEGWLWLITSDVVPRVLVLGV